MKNSYYKGFVTFLLIQLLMLSIVFISDGIITPNMVSVSSWLVLELGTLVIFVAVLLEQVEIWKKLLAGVVVYGLAFMVYSENIAHGAKYLLKRFIHFFNYYFGLAIYVEPGKRKFFEYAFVFAVLMIVFLSCMLYQKFKKIWILLIVPVILLILELGIGYAPKWLGIACLIALICFSIARITELDNSNGKRVLIVIFVVILISSTAGYFVGKATIKKSYVFKEFQNRLEVAIRELNFVTNFSNGKVDNHTPKYTGEEMFRVTSDTPVESNLYLKDFTAYKFVDNQWYSDVVSFEEDCQKAGYDPEVIRESLNNAIYDEKLKQTKKAHYSIEYTGCKSTSAFFPYYSKVKDEDISKRGDSIYKKGFWDKNIFCDSFANNSYLFGVYLNIDTWELMNESLASDEMKWYSSYAQKYADEIEADYLDDSFEDFIHNNLDYLIYTDGFSSIDFKEPVYSYVAALYLSTYFSQNYKYSLNLDETQYNTMDYFLNKSKKGYCVHFATTGVMFLRRLGIPARYASGYVVKEKDFKKNPDETFTASVKDSNAHAWVEIYLENIGWVPIEVTPGFDAYEEAEDESSTTSETEEDKSVGDSEIENSESTQADSTEVDNSEIQNAQEDKQVNATESANGNGASQGASGGTGKNGGKGGKGGKGGAGQGQDKEGLSLTIKIYLVITILAIIGYIVFSIVWFQKTKRGKKARPRMVIRTKMKLMKKHKQLYKKQHHRFKSDMELEMYLNKTHETITKRDWHEYMSIIKKARFSNEDITEEEFEKCVDIYTRLNMH